MQKKYIYFFGGKFTEGRADMKWLLGGKGANLAEMARLGIPVPPGFTITTEVCKLFYKNKRKLPNEVWKSVQRAMQKLERIVGKKFGDPKNPLLVSVRSGAPFSMPGMMDTILNLGLNDETVKGLASATNNKRFAYDCYRRFIAMFGDVVLGVNKEEFEKVLSLFKGKMGVKRDIDLPAHVLEDIVEEFKGIIKRFGHTFPQDPYIQLKMAIEAVFLSWNNDRAIFYRKQNKIPDDIGTAVNIQTMVFGNMGEDSATGVGFTRDPAFGEKKFYGEYLPNAQGEDVVAGVRDPLPVTELEKKLPSAYTKLQKIAEKLEKHYKDMQDIEFTIERGNLFLLQTRVGKRTAKAAVKIAVDMVNEKLITKEEAIMRVDPAEINQLLHPVFKRGAEKNFKLIAKGLGASPGAAVGKIVFDPGRAVELSMKNEKVILVRKETSPDDIHGMEASMGILTAKGGGTSHAAVVARQRGKPCVVGAKSISGKEIVIDEARKRLVVDGNVLGEGTYISLNGESGEVFLGEIPTEEPSITDEFGTFMKWCDSIRRLGVRANADTPEDAEKARRFGAEGIGLCRTEHMFFQEGRIQIMQKMIMAGNTSEREKFLAQLLPFQKEDFYDILRVMDGLPVTIRLLDPPLHEFLPKREELIREITEIRYSGSDPQVIKEKEEILNRVEELYEFNPMLGLRGCRLGIVYPEVTRMQVRAIFEAACQLYIDGANPVPEIMVPLIGSEEEMKHQRYLIEEVAKEVFKEKKCKIKYKIGTMIEIPRAALVADKIAKYAEFFSFGTNDLTQMTYGFSRDDAGKFIQVYMTTSTKCRYCGTELTKELKCPHCGREYEEKPENILKIDPFQTIDSEGVAELMRIAVEKGRSVRKDLKIGICGEHGGDPESIEICEKLGLDYVSCSPFRVPIARVSAARAVARKKLKKLEVADK